MRGRRAWPARVTAVCIGWLAATAGGAEAAVDLLLIQRVEAELVDDPAAAFGLLEDAVRDAETTPEERVDLLAELARLRAAHGDFADAGEAYALEADLVVRLEGATAPRLAGLYAAAAEAYAGAGDVGRALDLAEDALRIDIAYYDCASDVVERDHARLADLLTRLGDPAKAAAERRLAEDSAARCRDGGGPASRGIVVTNEFADANPDSFARVKVFYATDRAATGSSRPEDYYGGDRGQVDYGTVEVSVPRIHKPGAVESPSLIKLEWTANPERHFVITRLATMTADELFADMSATLGERRSDEAFVFVHGYNTGFADAAKLTAQIAYDINFAGVPIFYSWPSQANVFSYVSDEAVVRLSGRHLLRFLDELVSRSGARHINLIAHSMGNRAVADALELLATRRSAENKTDPVFEQVIFAAPDEDAGLFTEMIETIRPVARRLTLYSSDNDLALRASERLHGRRARAGQGGSAILVAPALDSIDMSILGEDMLGHSYFANAASALTDLSWLFWRDSAPDGRCGMDGRSEARGRFWLFDPLRCDGPAMLSALTLLKTEGAAALAKLDTIVARLRAERGKELAVAEWQAIRKAMAAASLAGR
ncbi:MAG: alpha/beta hydrolase [Bauldia sp.]